MNKRTHIIALSAEIAQNVRLVQTCVDLCLFEKARETMACMQASTLYRDRLLKELIESEGFESCVQ